MVSCFSFSQSLIPLVIKVDSTKYYCYDSVSIRQVAITMNNGFTCDSIAEGYKVIVQDYDSLKANLNGQVNNLMSQLTITERQNELQVEKTKVYKSELKKQVRRSRLLTIGIAAESVLIVILCITK